MSDTPFWADKFGKFYAYREESFLGHRKTFVLGIESTKAFCTVAEGLDEDDAMELARILNIYQEARGMLSFPPSHQPEEGK